MNSLDLINELGIIQRIHQLDEFENNAIKFLIERVNLISQLSNACTKTNSQIYPGEMSRVIQEFNPEKLDSKLGGEIINFEKKYFFQKINA